MAGKSVDGSREKTMPPTAIVVRPHDLAARVDPIGSGIGGASERDIDRSERAMVIEKTMHPTAIIVYPHDLAAGVDIKRVCIGAAGERDIDRSERKTGRLGGLVSPEE